MMKKLENGEENYGNGTGKEYWDGGCVVTQNQKREGLTAMK